MSCLRFVRVAEDGGELVEEGVEGRGCSRVLERRRRPRLGVAAKEGVGVEYLGAIVGELVASCLDGKSNLIDVGS